MTRALLEQALEALTHIETCIHGHDELRLETIYAIRAHLAQPQSEPVAAAGEDLAIYQSIADNYFKSIRPAHTEAEVWEIINAGDAIGDVVRRILGVPAP